MNFGWRRWSTAEKSSTDWLLEERKFADLWKLPPHHHYYTSNSKGQKWANGLAVLF